jgi:two-component system sensor histidine kinase/response regulator
VTVRPTDDAAVPAPRALEAYFEYALNGIVEADAQGRIVRANPAAASILGSTQRRLRGAALEGLLARDEESRSRLARHRLAVAEQGVSLTTLQVPIDGAQRTIELASIDVGEGGHLHIVDDITEQRQLTESLQAARRAADEANAAKSAFLANMSHEIRTPLNGIIGLERLLRLTPLTARQADYLDDLRHAAQTLLALLGDVLDFSRIESGGLDLERRDFDADEFLETVATACAPAAGSAVRLLFDIDPGTPRRWHGDPLRLAQAASNLLANAIKFTRSGHVILSVSWDAGGGGALRLAVSDTGMGMTAEQLQRVFSPFVQADPSVTRRYGGSGLGLAIARGVVERMGGRISASSQPGVGSEFVIEVPMGSAAVEARAPAAGAIRRAVVISDDARQRQALARLLAAEAIAVECRSAAEAGALPAAGEGTVVIVDDEADHGLIETMRGGDPAALLILFCPRPGATGVAAGADGSAVLRAPATPRRLRQAIAQCTRRAMPRADEVNPWQSLRDEYAGAAVLLVEDDPISRRVMSELLAFAGIEVTVGEDGRAACEALAGSGARAVQLVLMDVQMPVMDGLTATRRLRAAGVHTPVVALTAGASVEEREACFGAGMSDWLAKPPDLADLEAVLARWLPARRAAPAGGGAPSAATDPLSAADPLPGINPQPALQRFLGNRAAYAGALRAFVEARRPVISQIGTLLAAGQHEAAARSLHTLAGSAALLGAEGLQAVAQALESAARSGAGDPAGEGSRRLLAAFEEVAGAAGRLTAL